MSRVKGKGFRVRGLLRTLPLILVLAGSGAQAHPLAPVLLELEERGDGQIEVGWKQPLRGVEGAGRRPVLPAACARVATLPGAADALGTTERWLLDCGANGLVGQRLGVSGLDITGTDALLRVSLRDGRMLQRVLRPSEPVIEVPGRTPALAVARDYAGLGVRHILGGADHLLFVFGLLLLVGGGRHLVQTVTAFTVGHSITLWALPRSASCVSRRARSRSLIASACSGSPWSSRAVRTRAPPGCGARPGSWRGSFGLLHGLGFAGALAEVGLPGARSRWRCCPSTSGSRSASCSSWAACSRRSRRCAVPRFRCRPAAGARVPVYAMGSLAAFWCLERTALLVP